MLQALSFKEIFSTFLVMFAIIDITGSIPIFVSMRDKGTKIKPFQATGAALLLFVGIPIPGTGAWTGMLAASFLDMDFKKSVIAVILGVLMAGIIMGVGTYMVKMGAGGIFAFMANSK